MPDNLAAASGEIVVRTKTQQEFSAQRIPATATLASKEALTEHAHDDITEQNLAVPGPGASPVSKPAARLPTAQSDDSRGSIMGIGMSSIGSGAVAGEIPTKISPGGRVLVPGPNGLMQSATVRQLLQGYYELEVGGSGDTIWVPISGVVPD